MIAIIVVEPPTAVLAVAVAISSRLPPHWLSRSPYFFVISMVQLLFEFGASLPIYLPCDLQTFGRALAMFLSCEVSRSGPFTSLFTSALCNIVTDVLLLSFLVWRVSLPFSTYLRARDLSEIYLLVFLSLLDLC